MSPAEVSEPLTYVYRSVGGCDLEADVYVPPRRSEPSPVVMWLHGGALIFGSRTDVTPAHLRELLRRGYVVVSVDYRLAPGTKLPVLFTDVTTAYDWIRQSLPEMWRTDPSRVAVVGQSAGGYLSLLASSRLDPRPRAVVSLYGYGDIGAAWYGRPDPYYCRQPGVTREEALAAVGGPNPTCTSDDGRATFYLYCRQQGSWPQEVAGMEPASEPRPLAEWCPVLNVDEGTPPVLLMHGDEDTDVPCEQSVQMAEALARAGVEHRLIVVPGGSHGFDDDPSNAASALAIREVGRFLAEQFGS